MPGKGQPSKERKWADNAEKQKAYRERKKITPTTFETGFETLAAALCETGCGRLVKGLDPRNPEEAMKELAKRIGEGRLIFAKKEEPGARTERAKRAKERATAGASR